MRKFVAVIIVALTLPWTAGPVLAGKDAPAPGPSPRGAVSSDLSAGMTDIHDIKAPEPFPGMPLSMKLALAAAAVLALLALSFLAARYCRKKRLERQKPPPPPSPEETALNALRQIGDLMDTDGKMFYFRLSLALREYIGGKFAINAAEMTTEELLPALASLPIDEELASQTRRFFAGSDPVKFAGEIPERVKMERHYKFVRHFVKQTAETLKNRERPPGTAENQPMEKDSENR